MTSFVFTPTVPAPRIVSAALGVDANNKLTDADVGKPVKMAAGNNYVVCSADDEIEGFVNTIEPWTVNDGFSFGGVLVEGRYEAEVAAGSDQVAVGDYVLAAAQAALGTAGMAQVKKGVAASQSGDSPFEYTERSPNTFLWRVIRIISGNGSAGSKVLLEKV